VQPLTRKSIIQNIHHTLMLQRDLVKPTAMPNSLAVP